MAEGVQITGLVQLWCTLGTKFLKGGMFNLGATCKDDDTFYLYAILLFGKAKINHVAIELLMPYRGSRITEYVHLYLTF